MSTVEYVENYHPVPSTMPAKEWAVVGDFTRQAILDALELSDYTDIQIRTVLNYVGRLATYAVHFVGLPLTREAVFTEVNIFNLMEFHVESSNRTKGARRSLLLDLGRYFNPAGFPMDVERRYGYEAAMQPYSDSEVRALKGWSHSQGAHYRNMDAQVILGLCLGAGLRTSELMTTIGEHVCTHQGAVIVTPGGYRGAGRRRTVVTHRFEEFVLNRAQEVGPQGYLFKPNNSSRDTSLVSLFIKRSHKHGHIHPDTRRLRNTWVINHLYASLPEGIICDLAGLQDLQHYRTWVLKAAEQHLDQHIQHARMGNKPANVTQFTKLHAAM